MYDMGRGYFSYFTNWVWAAFSTYLPGTNKLFAVSMGEGIGVEYEGKDKAYEDFITYDGKIYKL